MPLFLYARVKFIRAESSASNTRILSESQRGSILLYCATMPSEQTSQKLHFVLLTAQRWSKSLWLVQYARDHFTYNPTLSVFCECSIGGIQYSITVLCQKCEANCSFSDFIDLTLLNIQHSYSLMHNNTSTLL